MKQHYEATDGEWDWFTEVLAPGHRMPTWQKTFTIRIFKWESTKDGKKLKRGPTLMRIRGNVGDRDQLVKQAEQEAKRLTMLEKLSN